MTDKERIDQLEQMVKTLAKTVTRLTDNIRTRSNEDSLADILLALRDTEEFEFWGWSKNAK